MLRRYILCLSNIFFILKERRYFMTQEEFIVYVDNLPDMRSSVRRYQRLHSSFSASVSFAERVFDSSSE